MNKWQIICPVVAMAIAAAVVMALIARSSNRDTVRNQIYQIGRDLIATTNSARVGRLGPELHERLLRLLASPTGVAQVKLGDEPPPTGGGKATGRLFLTNVAGQRLGIRFRREAAGKFDVLSFWQIAERGGPANGSQPIRSETNRTSSAAGSRR
jgi:hypothetical protein